MFLRDESERKTGGTSRRRPLYRNKTMIDEKKFKILFLCTGNSARSVFGEYLMNRYGKGKFEAYSAGASPKGQVNPMTIRVLDKHHNIDTAGARSKSWDEYKDVKFDFVITVCDNAKEQCPFWPGQPIIAHWGSPDPAAFEGNDEETEDYFRKVSMQIKRRIELMCCLPFEKLDEMRLEEMTKDIGNKETKL